MKLTDLVNLNEIDAGDWHLRNQVDRGSVMRTSQGRDAAVADAARRARTADQTAMAAPRSGNVWLVDRATGKKLSGPFKNDDAAISFKQNRKDKIPPDARIVAL